MARGPGRRRVSSLGLSSFAGQVMGVPRSFAFGLLAGLLVPTAALAGVVAGVYLFTGKVPFVTEVVQGEEERHLIVKLVEPDEARSLLRRGREAAQAFGDEIVGELESVAAKGEAD
jgi:hypothetical protein